MCIYKTDAGVRGLCIGCPKLVELQFNGLLRDPALPGIRALRHIDVLAIRHCPYITDMTVIRMVWFCRILRSPVLLLSVVFTPNYNACESDD